METLPVPYNKQSKRYDVTKADLEIFIALWYQRAGLGYPDIHKDIAKWLEWNWLHGDKRQLLMAFRSAGKSTIVGLYCAWLLYHNPSLRILVLAADFTLAKKMVGNVKRILERHPLTAGIKPKNAEAWAGDRFTVNRMIELRDPSMLAKGITSNITGSRADIIICDDVEVPNTCGTLGKRQDLRARLAETEFVLVPDGTMLYVGTPHHYHTIYADQPRIEFGEDAPFLTDYKRLEIPILDKHGESAWIERYSEAKIKRMKRDAGPNRFASQMMLQPRNIAEGRLNPDLLRPYDWELDYSRELKTLFLGGKKLTGASVFWDPAFGSAKGDHSVLAVLFIDEEGAHYLHHIEYIKLPPTYEEDEATEQAKIVAALAKRLYLPSITVEINGIGRFLPNMLRIQLGKISSPCRVVEHSQTRRKEDRILEAFDAILAARRLHVHKSIFKTPFITEMQEWQPADNKGHDDGLDAVAGALLQTPDRYERSYSQGKHNWMRGAKPQKAGTEFKV
ncbi:MAG: phage terminase large subunit [Alphaproteobacteria bacterium]